jgi:glycerol dehydrogenase-like iron-containing ADH family enzyme
VCAAKSSQGKQDGKKNTCKGEAADLASAKIKVNVSLDGLKNGKCDAVLNSKDYKDKKKKMDDKNKECTKLEGAAKMAKKALKNAIDAAKKARKTCTRQAKTSLDAAFKSAKKVCSSKANKKSFTRAMHMKCVLDGKSISGCGKANPPTVNALIDSK